MKTSLILILAIFHATAALAMTVDDVSMTRTVAERGNAPAQVLLGMAYLNGEGGLAVDARQAAYWLEKAAVQGNAYAERHLGDLYAEGRGVDKNPALALDWYQRAARRDDVDAELKLGRIYMSGQGATANTKLAVRWLEKAANSGSGEAAYLLSELLRRQEGDAAQNARVNHWLHHSASLGYAPAEQLWHLIQGFGESFRAFDRNLSYGAIRSLAEDGDPEAAYQLALRLEGGTGGAARDIAQSLQWFQRAADHGHVMAMRSLAQIYATGTAGVAANPNLAAHWQAQAERAGR